MGVFDVFAFRHISKASCACSNSWPTKKKLQASTRAHDPFFDEPKIWPSFIFSTIVPPHTFAKLPVHALINVLKKLDQKNYLPPNVDIWYYDLLPQSRPKPKSAFWHISKASCACSQFINQKKKVWASTRAHDPFFDEPKIWPSFIFSRVVPLNTFPKLPVYALINVLKKLDPKNYLTLNGNIWYYDLLPLSRPKPKSAFWHISKASCACSQFINQKQKLQTSTRAQDPFFDEPKIWPSFIFLRVTPSNTFAKLPLCALINVLKKLAQKKLIV